MNTIQYNHEGLDKDKLKYKNQIYSRCDALDSVVHFIAQIVLCANRKSH